MSRPDITPYGDGYKFLWQEEHVEILVERISERRDTLSAELAVRLLIKEGDGLHRSRMPNLLSARSQKELVNILDSRVSGVVDWYKLVVQLCDQVVNFYRQGEPPLVLAEQPEPEGRRWVLEPYVEQSGATVLFAKGGSGKSVLGLAVAVSVATDKALIGSAPQISGPVLYLDWEADAPTHRERLGALCRPNNLELPSNLYYRRETVALHSSADTIRSHLRDLEAVMVVIDSLGLARGGAPESAEETIRLFTAIRSLNVPALCIDHLSKEAMNRRRPGALPIGSVYTTNSARAAWGLERADEEGTDELAIILANVKANNGQLMPRRAYKIQFRNDGQKLRGIEIVSTDPARISALVDRLPVKDQLRAVLGHAPHPLTTTELVEEFDGRHSVAVLRTELNRRKDLFVNVGGKDQARWALLDKRPELESPF